MSSQTQPRSFFDYEEASVGTSLLGPQEKYVRALTLIEGQKPKCFGVLCRSVGYYLLSCVCGTTSFSSKNWLKSNLSLVSNNRFPTDNCQILNMSPFSSDFSQQQEIKEAIMSLVFYFFVDLMKTCLTSDHVTIAGYPYTCLHSTHILLLFIC